MKRVSKGLEPQMLRDLAQVEPNADWDRVRNSRARYSQIKEQIISDQIGLCAYCEIELLPAANGLLADFRVEHFYPKSPHLPPPNRATAWDNLLGACHGGSQRDVVDPCRFTPPDFCCDVPKGNINLVGQILNPLDDVPAYPCIYKFDNGIISVDHAVCPPELVQKASRTIAELRLDAERLNRLRREVIEAIQDQILALGTEYGGADEVAEALFEEDFASPPEFFSCKRWYLGQAAEKRLTDLGYA